MGQKSYANLLYTVSRHKAFNGITDFQTRCILLSWIVLFNLGGKKKENNIKKKEWLSWWLLHTEIPSISANRTAVPEQFMIMSKMYKNSTWNISMVIIWVAYKLVSTWFRTTMESSPLYSSRVPEVAACLTLQRLLSTPPALTSEDWRTQVLFSCFWSYE